MLAAPDQLVVRNDPALPGLPLLLDAEAFAEVLRPHIGALDAAEAVYVRYKPGENAIVAFRLYVHGSAHWAYAKAFRADATTKLIKASKRPQVESILGPGRLVLPGWATTISLFPNDEKLEALARLRDADDRVRFMSKLVPSRPDLWEAEPELLRYKPERRYVAKMGDAVLKLHNASGFGGATRGRRAISSQGPLQTISAIGRSRRHRALLYNWVEGRVMVDALRDTSSDLDSVAPVGRALATLHERCPNGLSVRTPEDTSRALFAAAASVGFTSPALAGRASSLASRIATQLSPPTRLALIHGDFYAKQIILSQEAPTILDFDELSLGHPAADFGTFLAHLERDRVRYAMSTARIGAIHADLLAGYREVLEPPTDREIALHSAASILRLAPHPFRFREPDWRARTVALITAAEAQLDLALRGASFDSVSIRRPAAVVDPENAASDIALPHLRRALNPDMAARCLETFSDQLAGHGGTATLKEINVIRHRPGRRALVEYTLNGADEPITLIGKVRAKGLDRTTFALMTTLWQGGFGPSSTDRVSVPEPVGIWPEARMWLQRRVPGVSAATALTGSDGARVAQRVARALVKLHRGGPLPARRHTLADELAHLHDRLPKVAHHHPTLAPRIGRVLAACDRLAASLPPARLRPLHRDFYPDNVLVAGTRLYLLDLDLYALGDPALDAGNFIAHLIEQGLREHGDPRALAGPALAFEDTFIGLTGVQSRLAVWAYTSLSLARHLFISTRIPERRPLTPALLNLCEQRLLGFSVMPQPAEV